MTSPQRNRTRTLLASSAVAAAAATAALPALSTAAAPQATATPNPVTSPDQDVTVKAKGLKPRTRYSVRASNFSGGPSGCEFTVFPAPNPVKTNGKGRLSATLDVGGTGSEVTWCNGTYTVTIKLASNLKLKASTKFKVRIAY